MKLHSKPTYEQVVAALQSAVEMLEHLRMGESYRYTPVTYIERVNDFASVLEAATNRYLENKEPRNVRHCRLCAEHYQDGTDTCDEGKPVASPHRNPALLKRQAE